MSPNSVSCTHFARARYDGVRRGLDDVSFVQRFSPRRAKSKWSAVNLRHFKRLTSEGRVEPPGLSAFRARDKHARPYSFETKPVKLDRALAAKLKANARARAFFQSQAPWHQRLAAFFVMSAKREETRQKRLARLIACSAAGKTILPWPARMEPPVLSSVSST